MSTYDHESMKQSMKQFLHARPPPAPPPRTPVARTAHGARRVPSSAHAHPPPGTGPRERAPGLTMESRTRNGREERAEPGGTHAHASRPHHQNVVPRSVRAPACGAAGRWSLSFAATATATPPRVDLGSASPSLYPATRPCLAWASPFHSPFTVHGIAMTL